MNRWTDFIAKEIEVEQKSPLYCYTILGFYLGFQLLSGSSSASIWVIVEIVAATYIMGFVQLYLMGSFDEAERLTAKNILFAVICSLVYTAVSWLGGWFGRSLPITALFFAFMLLCYGCVYWFFSVRRSVTTRQMNSELAAYKQKIKEKENEDKQ